MTTPDLSSYGVIQTALVVEIYVEYYKANSSATPSSVYLRFSDYNLPLTVDGNVYSPTGQLLGITATENNLRAAPGGVSISLSGIPNASISEIINSRFKGSPVVIKRVLFNPTNGQLLSIAGNPVGRFEGVIENYSLQEDFTPGSQTTSNTIVFSCSSKVESLENKISGRRTNTIDQETLYPGDTSMDRVTKLSKSNFNFGAPIG